MSEVRYNDRELSWLDFNERVLQLAEDTQIPLLERTRFVAIFSSNLDEFYMVRVATLKEKIATGITLRNSAGLTPILQMKKITERTKSLTDRLSKLFLNNIRPALSEIGIEIIRWDQTSEHEKEHVNQIFASLIFPVLTPLAVDPSRPFPYISGLSLNLAVIVRNPKKKEESFARVKIPTNLPRFISTTNNSDTRYIPLEQVIAANLLELFPGMQIIDQFTFRLTRNADLELEEDDVENLISSMEQELQRRKFGPPVRLEVEKGIDVESLDTLIEELDVNREEVISVENLIDFTSLHYFADFEIPEARYPKFKSTSHPLLGDPDEDNPEKIFAAMRGQEIMLHHPYQSFTGSVVNFIEKAAQDPQVLAIKQTLYRTSGDSPIIQALIEAAESGKQVLAVIELRARFDEMANVRWARKLEDAGVHVVYGLLGFKTHAKLSLVIREESNGIRSYSHVGTGNYNPKTARLYDDLGILSADPVLGRDLTILFNQLSGYAPDASYQRLLVAPKTLRSSLIQMIKDEIKVANDGLPAEIRFKLNSLVDEEFCDYLYLASQAGVKVKLWIRGISAIKPGVIGFSENIEVRSILGRFLEHSRIFNFKGNGENIYFIGSADLMERNLDRRVESLVKIENEDHKSELDRQFTQAFSNEIQRWELIAGDRWQRFDRDEEEKKLIDYQENEIQRWRGL